ncbi:hypothetical protein RUND412_008076 [Rhizina undulata]
MTTVEETLGAVGLTIITNLRSVDCDRANTAEWVPSLVRWAKAHEVNVWNDKGDIEKVLAMSSNKGKKKLDQWDEAEFARAVDKWVFEKTLARIKKKAGKAFGGHKFDISRWSEVQKRAHRLDLDDSDNFSD